jgi:aminopeptidase N
VYDLADFEVNLHLADGPKGLVVAASSPGKQDGEWLRYQRSNTRSFALSIGSEYESQTEKVGNISITSYYFPLNVEAGKRALKTTVEAMKLYQELFGPYPHDTLAVVEADFYDGMEYDGLYFLSRAFYNTYKAGSDNYLVAIAAHETAHQWFYGIIGSDQANEPWLDEALATYTERLYYEKYAPDALQWWWYYRINYTHPTGWVDSSVYNPQGALQTYQDYRDAVYLNGANFMEDLRKAMGDKDFFAFFKDYTTQYAGQIALGRDFFALMKQHTPVDLTPVISKYFERPPTN